MTPSERDSLLAEYEGLWVLDEAGSSPQVGTPEPPEIEITGATSVEVSAQDVDRFRLALEAELERMSAIHAVTLGVVRSRPDTVVLQVRGEQLVYNPAPGPGLTLALDGGSVVRMEEELEIRTWLVLEASTLGIRHVVASEGRVAVVLEIVGGRLRMTRIMQVGEERVGPIVLWYDRERAGSTTRGARSAGWPDPWRRPMLS